jgi:mannose-6-phosphate isomerase-like protein (cupin superfamily)
MTYIGNLGEQSAVMRRDVEPIPMGPGTASKVSFVGPGSVTRGEFGLFRWDMPAGVGGANPHFHRGFSESFYVLSGTVSLYDGDRWMDATEGNFLYVPPGGIHAFSNESGEPASMLILFTPGIAREKFFEELSEIRHAGRELTDEEWADLFARHDQVNL